MTKTIIGIFIGLLIGFLIGDVYGYDRATNYYFPETKQTLSCYNEYDYYLNQECIKYYKAEELTSSTTVYHFLNEECNLRYKIK